jgi:hypothetical protein
MKYIVWINYGYDGWSPNQFNTFQEAFEYATKENYGKEFKITIELEYKVTAQES